MPAGPAPDYWIDDAARTLAAGLPVKCWGCAVTVPANKIDMPGRCKPPGRELECPLNVAAAAAKQKVA